MHKRFGSNLFCLFCLVLALFFSATACVQPNTASTRQTVKGSALLSDITMEDGFQYKDYPWFISESDFFAKSKMDAKTAILSQQGTLTLISDKQTQTYDVPKISIFLDEVPPNTGEGLGMVTWAGNDSSGMVIATFNHTKAATDSNNYVISIEISPPGTR